MWSHPAVHPTEGVLMRRMRTGRMRRLRVRPSQPNSRGPRETLPGPTTWVCPATGWWKRMKAGESPLNQGRSVKAAPVRFQKAVPRSKEKRRGEAPIGAPVRVMDRLFPPAGGTGLSARQTTGCGDPHQRLSALCPLGAGDIPQTAAGRRPPRTMARACATLRDRGAGYRTDELRRQNYSSPSAERRTS
jgi:hypothetical protein